MGGMPPPRRDALMEAALRVFCTKMAVNLLTALAEADSMAICFRRLFWRTVDQHEGGDTMAKGGGGGVLGIVGFIVILLVVNGLSWLFGWGWYFY
jgi:hypothetical protein